MNLPESPVAKAKVMMVATVVALNLMSSCGDSGSGNTSTGAERLVGVWQPTELNGAPYADTGDEPITVEFTEEGRYETSDGCNAVTGVYSLEESRFSSDGTGMSEVGCTGERVPIPEVLNETSEIRFSGNQMTMLNQQEEELASFERN